MICLGGGEGDLGGRSGIGSAGDASMISTSVHDDLSDVALLQLTQDDPGDFYTVDPLDLPCLLHVPLWAGRYPWTVLSRYQSSHDDFSAPGRFVRVARLPRGSVGTGGRDDLG